MEYRAGQASEILEIPSSTLRRYVKQFSIHLSESAIKPRGRRFSERDLIVLENVRILLGRKLTPQQVAEQLPIIGDEKLSDERSLVPMAEIQKWMDQMSEIALNLRDEIEELRADNADMAARLSELERPAWRRILERLSSRYKEDQDTD